MRCPCWPEETVESPGTRVTNSRELPYECLGLNSGSLLQEQPVLVTTEPSCQPLEIALLKVLTPKLGHKVTKSNMKN